MSTAAPSGRRAGSPRLSVAPMMGWTDRAYRRMMRRITRRTLLYTEMITTGALLHGDAERFLAHHPEERPLALQLGGDDPGALAACARLAQSAGFSEVNLNVGCPSDRVQQGRFGACLMAEPARVADCVAAMREASDVAVTVKHRIGIDDLDAYEDMRRFVDVVAAAGADRFTVHARKAWLRGLSPKQNRTVPPLRYDDVRRLAAERPDEVIELNGGVRDLDTVLAELRHVPSVMVGRAAFEAPMRWAEADARVFGEPGPAPSLRQVVDAMHEVIEDGLARGVRLATMVKPLIPLVRGVPGARAWRRTLTEEGVRPAAGPEVLHAAARHLPDHVLNAPGGPDAVQGATGTVSSRTAHPVRTPHREAASPSRRPTSSVPSDPR